MSVSNKVKALLNLTNSRPRDIAEPLGISVQAVRNKFTRDSFSMDDLIKICDHLDAKLFINLSDSQTINFEADDVKKK